MRVCVFIYLRFFFWSNDLGVITYTQNSPLADMGWKVNPDAASVDTFTLPSNVSAPSGTANCCSVLDFAIKEL